MKKKEKKKIKINGNMTNYLYFGFFLLENVVKREKIDFEFMFRNDYKKKLPSQYFEIFQ